MTALPSQGEDVNEEVMEDVEMTDAELAAEAAKSSKAGGGGGAGPSSGRSGAGAGGVEGTGGKTGAGAKAGGDGKASGTSVPKSKVGAMAPFFYVCVPLRACARLCVYICVCLNVRA